jgi:ketosteroid isomerase-like protein
MRTYPISRSLLACSLAALGWFGASASRQSSAADGDSDRTAILAVLTLQQRDWNRGDNRGFMAGYWNSPEVTFAGSQAFTRGWQPVLERYQRRYADRAAMGTLDFSELEVRKLGPATALVLGRWRLERQAGDVGGIFTLVFQKFPEGWKIIHDHTTQSPAETPASH